MCECKSKREENSNELNTILIHNLVEILKSNQQGCDDGFLEEETVAKIKDKINTLVDKIII